MKKFSIPRTALLCVIVVIGANWFVNAGPPSLTPPPGPIMESGRFGTRCDILSLPGNATALHVIDQPGSYYLSGNLMGQAMMHGIQIAGNVDNVTIDLNGFSLIGVTDSLNGINMVTFAENCVIKNGHAHTWGGDGMFLRIDIGRVENITSSRNLRWGIYCDPSSFSAKVVSCEVWRNGDPTDATLYGGIFVDDHGIVRDCLAHDNNGDGLRVGPEVSVLNCVATSNSEDGIQHASNCLIRGCIATGNVASQYNGSGAGSLLVDNR